MFSIFAHRLAPFATCFTSFFWGELVGVAPEMSDLSTSAGYLALFLWVHGGEPSRLLVGFLLYISHVGLLSKCVRSQMWTQGT
jgi:hypothetical protein